MKRLSVLVVCATLACAQPVLAQVAPSALGVTSPLGIGPGAQVGPTGIPMGATQLMTPGLSPLLPASPNCSASGLTSGIQSSIGLFDAGMNNPGGATMQTMCPTNGNPFANPSASASSPNGMSGLAGVGRTGIPMGATEIDSLGVSPQPPTTIFTLPSPAASLTTSPLAAAPTIVAPTPSMLPSTTTQTVPPGTPCPSTGMLPPSGMC